MHNISFFFVILRLVLGEWNVIGPAEEAENAKTMTPTTQLHPTNLSNILSFIVKMIEDFQNVLTVVLGEVKIMLIMLNFLDQKVH